MHAKYGWYRYDTRLALPVYNDIRDFIKVNIKSRISNLNRVQFDAVKKQQEI